ncbi:MAG: MBL fold metallo-hydrolase [Myxococcota bacterium]|nr:MBL fold metallo-hydrolase [Myxococcota bacterium]
MSPQPEVGLAYRIIPVTPFQQNCSLVWCRESREAALIDPGGEEQRLLRAVEEEGVILRKLLLTHGHLDHAGAAERLRRETGCEIIGPHRGDDFWLAGLPQQSMLFGFPPVSPFQPDRWLEGGEELALGTLRFQVIHCPGHTPGHLVFFSKAASLAFVGDVIFEGSVGRTDFPQGSFPDLRRSIREHLFPLGDEVTFVPGHGPTSTFGRERRSNPFVGDQANL